jgi:pimeloyl-[acyl-carrier protein] synthase
MTRALEPLFYNPMDPEVHADPYPHYRRLREEDPVHRSPLGFWVLSRYADVAALVRDPRFGHELPAPDDSADGSPDGRYGPGHDPADRSQAGVSMLFRDPPDHTRLRGLVNKAFTPRAVEALRSRVKQVVGSSLARAREAGEMDVISALAFPLPVTVIGEMLGLPREDYDQCRIWTDAIGQALDPVMSQEDFDRFQLAEVEFHEYLRTKVAERRRRPGADLLSALIAAEEAGDRLTEGELIVTLALLFAAGHETTTNLIGNGMLALLRNPDQLARLRSDPALIRSAVEELLRYDSPVQFVARIAKEPVEIGGGEEIALGESVMGLLGAANRDPAQFPEPDLLDIERADVRHLSFGGGIHFCLGGTLARIEGQVAIDGLVRGLPGLELASDDLRWREHINLRGLKALPVRFGAPG